MARYFKSKKAYDKWIAYGRKHSMLGEVSRKQTGKKKTNSNKLVFRQNPTMKDVENFFATSKQVYRGSKKAYAGGKKAYGVGKKAYGVGKLFGTKAKSRIGKTLGKKGIYSEKKGFFSNFKNPFKKNKKIYE